MKIDGFKDHTGTTHKGESLNAALHAVAEELRAMYYAIKEEDLYADHVTEAYKAQALKDGLDHVAHVESGIIETFTDCQRLNTKLTGKCIAFFYSKDS